MHKRRKKH
jgi:hypothetical protein